MHLFSFYLPSVIFIDLSVSVFALESLCLSQSTSRLPEVRPLPINFPSNWHRKRADSRHSEARVCNDTCCTSYDRGLCLSLSLHCVSRWVKYFLYYVYLYFSLYLCMCITISVTRRLDYLFNIRPFVAIKKSHNRIKVCQRRYKILPIIK